MEKRELSRKLKLMSIEEKLAMLSEKDKANLLNLLVSGKLTLASLLTEDQD